MSCCGKFSDIYIKLSYFSLGKEVVLVLNGWENKNVNFKSCIQILKKKKKTRKIQDPVQFIGRKFFKNSKDNEQHKNLILTKIYYIFY